MGGHTVTMLQKISLRHHEGVAAATEMSIVLELFCKEITGVDFARYVQDFNCLVLHVFTDGGFM